MRNPEYIFEDAFDSFIAAEGGSLTSGISERNTCGRLSIYLERQLQIENIIGYYADIEYNRKQNNQVKTIINDELEIVKITSDLIVHTRGEMPPPYDNLIAIEAKKASRPEQEKIDDRLRLKAMTKKPYDDVWPWNGGHPEHVCGYKLGVFIEINTSLRQLILQFFKDGAMYSERIKTF